MTNTLVSTKKGAANLLLFVLLYQFALAFTSYINIYLQDNGFTASQVSAVNAFGFVASLVCFFASGFISDKLRSIKKVLVPTIIVCIIAYSATPLFPTGSRAFVLIMMLYLPLCIGFKEMSSSLVDNILVRSCAEHGYNFGLQRAGGSLTFALCGALCTLAVPKLGAASTFWLYSVVLIPSLFFLCRTPEPRYVSKRGKLELRSLLSNKPYWVFVIFMFVYYLASKPFHSLMTLYMQEKGMSTAMYGLVVAFRAALEVPSLLLMVRLRRKVPLPLLVILGGIFLGITSLSMGLAVKSFPAFLLIQVFTGLGNGLNIGSATNYINSIAPDDLKATASSILMMAASLAGLLGNLFGGPIIEWLGSEMFYTILGVILILSVAGYYITAKLLKISFIVSKV
ncbi:MAG: MFS transporter [Oscillospiraceae bacterium]